MGRFKATTNNIKPIVTEIDGLPAEEYRALNNLLPINKKQIDTKARKHSVLLKSKLKSLQNELSLETLRRHEAISKLKDSSLQYIDGMHESHLMMFENLVKDIQDKLVLLEDKIEKPELIPLVKPEPRIVEVIKETRFVLPAYVKYMIMGQIVFNLLILLFK